MTAGGLIPIQVDFYSSRAFDEINVMKPLVAQLFWQSAQTPIEIVPAEVFVQPDGSSGGLYGQYQSERPIAAQNSGLDAIDQLVHQPSFEQVDANIDLVSLHGGNIGMRNRDMMRSVTEELWNRVTADKTLSQLETEQAVIPLINSNMELLDYFSTDRRRQLAAKLLEKFTPDGVAIADTIDENAASYLYLALRLGAPEDALNVLGTWIGSHRVGDDGAPILANGKFDRQVYRYFAVILSDQYPEHFVEFREKYLVTEDGGCCVPSAYVLGYAAMIGDTLDAWIAELDTRISESEGDAKATWLMARAMAEEIRNCPAKRHILAAETLDAGEPFLEQACNAAVSPEVKSRAYRERVARAMATRRPQRAREILQDAGPEAARLGQEVDQLVQEERERVANAKLASASDYLSVLQDRLAKAQARGDSARVARYQQLISAAQVNVETKTTAAAAVTTPEQ